ncbi:hypothetical protein B0G66_12231 [Bacillus badius]|nr:hypothetical protein B0G66_12231 [Bacillus badius]
MFVTERFKTWLIEMIKLSYKNLILHKLHCFILINYENIQVKLKFILPPSYFWKGGNLQIRCLIERIIYKYLIIYKYILLYYIK